MYKCVNGNAPDYLVNNINLLSDVMPYNSRSKDSKNVLIPDVRTEQCKSSFMYNGAKIWNDLPNYVQCSSSCEAFKNNYKKYIFNA